MLADRSTSAVEKLRNLDSSERERSDELVKSPRNARKSFGRAINGDFSSRLFPRGRFSFLFLILSSMSTPLRLIKPSFIDHSRFSSRDVAHRSSALTFRHNSVAFRSFSFDFD